MNIRKTTKLHKTLFATIVSATLLGACANSPSNTQKGAGIGAVVGAIAGKATGDNDKSRYVWGAALGALAGTAIGNYMDKQEQELKKELSDTGVEVVREGDNIRLVIPGSITFATDSAAISSDFYPVLSDVATVLAKYDKTKLSIEGHTDNVGNSEYNETLSLARANSVAKYLASSQVASERLRTIGHGESQPVADNSSAESRRLNRRVELSVIPINS